MFVGSKNPFVLLKFFCKPGRGCCDFNYDLYTRIVPKPPPKPKAPTTSTDAAKSLGGKKKLKSGKFDKKKGKRERSKSPPKKKKN